MPERLNGTAWKAVPRKRPVGSNPTLSAESIFYRSQLIQSREWGDLIGSNPFTL